MNLIIEKNYKHMIPYLNFQYDSPSIILEYSFDTSYYNQYDASPSGELPKVQSNVLVEMKGGNTRKEVT
jgi:hypothetical protein